MSQSARNKKTSNIFLRMHPLQRILLSFATTLIVFLFIRQYHFDTVLLLTVLWDTFAITFISCSWIVFFTRPSSDIAKLANKEDGSRPFVLISIVVSSFASMFTVLLFMLSKEQEPGREVISVILSITGMVVSWIMVHTIFTFHYAHLYYSNTTAADPVEAPLDFPSEKTPDYLDFAYFSFVIGMTFQVSDVSISSRVTRRTALGHALLAFALNTFVVALTINLIAGLKK